MFTPPTGVLYKEPKILVKNTRLEVVDTFPYVGSIISKYSSLDAGIVSRTQKESVTFGKLEIRICSDGSIIIKTKVSEYSTLVITSLVLLF